ncbi:MAG: hypothetical protein AAGK17_00095 [Pseudomonadota bacterium]
MRHPLILALAGSLAACSGGSSGGPASTVNSAATRAPAPVLMPSQSVRDAGLEGVIGANSAGLLGQFGKARIDLKEGFARKLQFADENCVLDIFLYPLQSGQEPVATHIEARNRQTGTALDKAACAKTLRNGAKK